MDLFLYFFHTFTIFTILIIVYYYIVLIVTQFIFTQLSIIYAMCFIFIIFFTILFYFHTTIISVPKIYSIVVIVVVWVYLTDATHNMITSIKFKTINLNPILNITPIINNS